VKGAHGSAAIVEAADEEGGRHAGHDEDHAVEAEEPRDAAGVNRFGDEAEIGRHDHDVDDGAEGAEADDLGEGIGVGDGPEGGGEQGEAEGDEGALGVAVGEQAAHPGDAEP
jgi:hypothetical protein